MKKSVAVLLLLTMLLPLMFTACNNGESNLTTPSVTDPDTGNETEAATDVETEFDSDDITDIGDTIPANPTPDTPGIPDEPETPVKCDPIKLDGVSITEYTIIYPEGNDYAKLSGELLARKIEELSGDVVKVASDSVPETELEIRIGKTNRGKADTPSTYYAYKVRVAGKKLILGGYDQYAIANAGLGLVEAFKAANGNVDLSKLKVSYTLPDREEYIEDIDKLYMRWAAEWEPDPRMLDYGAMIDAYTNVSDRLLTCAHRADGDYYPENSIEGIISFYKMGGDVVELDIQATKDGVLILMHDDTLKRMTNWEEVKGTVVNGVQLPTSNNVIDWTYEQIQQLYLRELWGGNNAKVTPFKVATLVEALKVCKNRMLIVPDKTSKWRYTENDNLTGSQQVFMFDDMVKADNYQSILLSYGLTVDGGVAAQKYIYDKSGVVPLLLIRDNSAPYQTYKKLRAWAMEKSYGVQINGHFNPETYIPKYSYHYEKLKGVTMIWAWTIDGTHDIEQYWKQMYDLGHRMIMTNDVLGLVKYAAKTWNFDETNG